MSEFKREQKYLVVKLDDAKKYLSAVEQENLEILLNKVFHGRAGDDKTPNSYVVVNEDEPYANIVWGLTEAYSGKHDWKCISPGYYDDLYECTKCGKRHMSQADNSSTWLTEHENLYGCPGEKEDKV